MRKIRVLMVITLCAIIIIIPTQAEKAYSYTEDTISLNQWTPCMYRESGETMRFWFTLDEPGWIRPVMHIKQDDNSSNYMYAYVKNSARTKIYCEEENVDDWEDGNGVNWNVQTYHKMRLPAGTYCFEIPSEEYGWGNFRLYIKYRSEEYRTNVEKEFNNFRNRANRVYFKKMYYGNLGYNDVDYYKIKLTKKKTVTISMYYPEETWGGAVSPWECCKLVNKRGTTLADAEYIKQFESSNGKVWNKIRVKKRLKKGTYYIRINNNGSGSDDYKFKVIRK